LRAKGRIVIAVPLIALTGTTSADLLLQRDESLERNVSPAARALASVASVASVVAYLTTPVELGELLDTFAGAQARDRQPQPAIRIAPS
jgi:hypothetical protein